MKEFNTRTTTPEHGMRLRHVYVRDDAVIVLQACSSLVGVHCHKITIHRFRHLSCSRRRLRNTAIGDIIAINVSTVATNVVFDGVDLIGKICVHFSKSGCCKEYPRKTHNRSDRDNTAVKMSLVLLIAINDL